MSNLFTKDQDKVAKGRKNSLKDTDELRVTADTKDQILTQLKTNLEDRDLGKEIIKKWYQANSDRQEWTDRQKEYLKSWDEFLVSSDNGPFEGSSNLHLPMPLIVCKTLHARFLQALVGSEPYFQAKSRTEAMIERQQLVEDTMMWYLKDKANYDKGALTAIDDWVWDWLTIGSGILKIRWDVQFERYLDVEETIVEGPGEIIVDEEGNEQVVPTFEPSEETIERVEKTFEGPVFETVNFEDICIVKGDGDPQRADYVMERVFLTASQLWTLADRKVFSKDAVEKVIKGGRDYHRGSVNTEIKDIRDRNSGHDTVIQETELDRYEIVECYLNADVDDSGINSKVVAWVHVRSSEILGANYLRRMHKSGTVPYFKADFHRRRNQEHGIGIVEMMYPLTTEMDALHNMRIDFGLLATMPIGFYRPTSSMNPETLSLEPGMLIPVDNPQTDIVFPNMGNRTSFGFQEEAGLMSMIERLTGVNDMTLGLQNQQGAARTATGARALVNESSSNLDVHLRRLSVTWKQALRFLLDMLQQRIPEDLAYRLTGDDGADWFRRLRSKDDIRGDYDIEIDANSASSNQQIRVATADTVSQLQMNPLAVQLGLVGPSEVYEGIKNQLMARGSKDIHRFFRKPQEQRLFTPKEVVDRTLRGVETPVGMNDDHEGIIKYIHSLFQQDEIMSRFLPGDVQALAMKLQQHTEMLQALEQIAAQQRNMAQMSMNAQSGGHAQLEAGAPAPQGGGGGQGEG
jgi:hypothetical protein